jgi:hypothetical protein
MNATPLLLYLGLLVSLGANARETAEFPADMQIDGMTLVKNGEGERLYGLLGIKVYRAALYLPRRSRSDRIALDIDAPRIVRMRYIHGASADDAHRAWRAYLEKNCTPPCTWPAPGVNAFLALISAVDAGDQEQYVFRRENVEVSRNGRAIGRVEAPGFSRLLLSTWIGMAPTTSALKRALLGEQGESKK